jgi:hypothetical protein
MLRCWESSAVTSNLLRVDMAALMASPMHEMRVGGVDLEASRKPETSSDRLSVASTPADVSTALRARSNQV